MEQIKLIGVCLSTIHEEDRFNFVKELNKHAILNGYRLLIFNSCADMYEQTPESNEGSAAVYNLIPYDRLSAIIIFPNIMYNQHLINNIIKQCREFKIPIISMDKKFEGCIKFSFNNSDIFEKLCRHVIEDHGARKLYMMAGFENNIYSEERIDAFKRALERNHIPFEQENIGYGCFWEQPTLDVLRHWFEEEKKEIPDAIICANDFMAIAVSGYLQQMGVKIPEDCIVTGFDGIKQTEYLPPKITTCKQDFDTMGKKIMETIIRYINGEKVESSYYIDFNIVYSQSCGCKPVDYNNVNNSIQSLLASLRLSDERQKMICSTQTSVPKISDINYLLRIIINRFKINTCLFAMNENVFSPPDFGSQYIGDSCFSEYVDILYHRYDKVELEQCRIPIKNLLPRYDKLILNELPIIVCCTSFRDMVMGYCVFQPELDIDEYDKMHSLMSTFAAALGNYHGRVQIRSYNDELQKISQRDFMTGLFNRRGFFERLETIINDGNHVGSTLVLISADLDELKYINDTFGHSEGDNAIITVGRALISSSLQSKLCARFGGDEFCAAIIIPDKDPKSFYEAFKKRFLNSLSQYNMDSGKPYAVRASIGFSYGKIDSNLNTDDVIRKADEKMYAYKLAHKRRR